ncbi:MAG TPA: class I SAM-dependent methyltransferase [Pyrinomonadaceae bacterium]|nr:class I SAM-dependent methyltransferase [Pyrinomonadaceae bacterium]
MQKAARAGAHRAGETHAENLYCGERKRLTTHTPPTRPPIYDALAPHYDRALRPLERLLLRRLRAAALRSLRAGAGARLLEIGAGTGVNFAHYPTGAHVVAATDPSREMLRVARRKPQPAGVRLVQTGAETLPFADDAFDAAFATLVFCSLASPPQAFAELRRVVRAGGRIVLLEHVRPPNPLGYVFDAISFFTVPLFEDHFNRRTAEDAARAGLRILCVERHALGIIQIIVCEV